MRYKVVKPPREYEEGSNFDTFLENMYKDGWILKIAFRESLIFENAKEVEKDMLTNELKVATAIDKLNKKVNKK